MSENLPLVSIIIPVFNGSDFLGEAIDSALGQTYKNIEVIVVNDGSRDNGETERIALSYGAGIRYFYKENGGVATALNKGILEMRGEYFSWLSHDDLYLPHKIQSQIDYILFNKNKDVVVYSDYVNVDSENNELYKVIMDHELLSKKPLYAIFRGALHGCTLLIPRTCFINVGIFNNLKTTQDYDLWFRMIRRHHFAHMPDVLVRSRLHPKQGSRHIDSNVEANDLWIRMMNSLSDNEFLTLENSKVEFYKGMEVYLSNTPYKEALSFVKGKLTEPHIENEKTNIAIETQKNFRKTNKISIDRKIKIKNLLAHLGLFKYINKIKGKSTYMYNAKLLNDNQGRAEKTFVESCKILVNIVNRK